MSDRPGDGEDVGGPIFVVAPPRSGGALLASALARVPELRLVERDLVLDALPEIDPARRAEGDRLTAAEADHRAVAALREGAERLAGEGGERRRLLHWVPRNALRVSFLAEAFPEARFVYVYRSPESSLAAIAGQWERADGAARRELPGWKGPGWTGPLIPGWRELSGRELPELVAAQWRAVTETLLEDLDALPSEAWAVTDHLALVRRPDRHVERICGFLGLEANEGATSVLRMVSQELDALDRGFRRGTTPELGHLGQSGARLDSRARELLADDPDAHRPASPGAISPLRSVHTASMPAILERLGASMLVTTYQSGRLICARNDGGRLNTHFRSFGKPMGLAVHRDRFAMGGREEVWDFRNLERLAPLVEPKGRHDACYLPRNRHLTGDIAIHEMEFARGELWIVATAFSCLGTLDADHSFVPRWKPPFISEITTGDRCHLNGLCVIDDEPRYVTALGTSDEPGGWRERKADGGVIIDVRTGETVVEGLSMPHSPRWHRDRLWVLESGQGALAAVDPETGTWERICELPGFTRGIAFAGDIALVGLSQIRETATFGGLPITERLEERLCGVWAVNLVNGEVVGFLRFEELVQEVFEVALLPHRFPEIAEPGSSATRNAFKLPRAEAGQPGANAS